jgi:hypothetical protein
MTDNTVFIGVDTRIGGRFRLLDSRAYGSGIAAMPQHSPGPANLIDQALCREANP